MERAWGILFLAGLAAAVPLDTPKTLEEALSQVIEIYNRGPRVQNAFRLLEATAPLELDPTTGTLQQLTFTMQETTCPNSENVVTEQCEFKPDGLIKGCTGYFSTEPGNPAILVSCDNVVQEPVRVTRFRGLGGFVRGFSRGIRFWDSNQ
uniref:cathelicidin-3-like n=1 Tax=Euleptes europaea TaxID=460621 RepID=UPI0025407708|nr:cathelicidin-3-like [Euleptes europaea]